MSELMDNSKSLDIIKSLDNSLHVYSNPFTTVTQDDAPSGYCFKWCRLTITSEDTAIDKDNLLHHEKWGWQVFLPSDDWRPDIARSKNGYVIFKNSLILSIKKLGTGIEEDTNRLSSPVGAIEPYDYHMEDCNN